MKNSGDASFVHLFHLYKYNAKARKVSFELTRDQFGILTKGLCFHCGAEPSMPHKRLISNGAYLCNGVDRLDNKIGYTTENSVSCCTRCNMMKKAMSAEEFFQACQAVSDHQKLKAPREIAAI